MKLSWIHVVATALITALGSVATVYPHLVWIPLASTVLGVVGTIGVTSVGQAPPKGGPQ